MDIGRTDGVGGPGRIDGPNKVAKTTPAASTSETSSADKVDLSLKAGMISKALGLPAVRAERVAEIRNLIESGRFDTSVRLEAALDRFLIDNPDV